MKAWFKYAAIGVAVYLIALLVTFPARLGLAVAVPALQKNGVSLAASGLDGTVWSGSASRVAFQGNLLGSATWSLSPFRLLLGQLGGEWELKPEGGTVKGTFAAGFGGTTTLRAVEGRLPADEALRYAPPLPVRIGGSFSFRFEELVLVDGRLAGAEGTLLWNQAELTQPFAMKLGDLRLALKPAEDGVISGEISDGGGPLDIKGTIQLGSDGNYTLKAGLAARSGADPALAQGLALLGPADSQGRHPFVFSGRL